MDRRHSLRHLNIYRAAEEGGKGEETQSSGRDYMRSTVSKEFQEEACRQGISEAVPIAGGIKRKAVEPRVYDIST